MTKKTNMNKVQFLILFTQQVQRSDSAKRERSEKIFKRPLTEPFIFLSFFGVAIGGARPLIVGLFKGTSVGSECNQPKTVG